MYDKQCQFPADVCETALADHTYYKCHSPPSITEDMDEDDCNSQGSQVDLFPELSDDKGEILSQDGNEPMEVVLSQETVSSEFQSSQSEFLPTDDGDEQFCSQEQDMAMDDNYSKERIFLVYDEKLRELLRFCPSCESPIVPESSIEVQNEGS